ncbi:MAG: glycosyltransferase [Verrucomicrobiota bacterium]
MKKISIVVPAYNEEKLISLSLRSMKDACAAFSRLGWETEIVVCDNNSTDRTAELALAEGAVVVFEPVNQISRARNKGGFSATGDWLVFVDADSYPSRALFADVAAHVETGKYAGGGATVTLDCANGLAVWLVRGWNCLSRSRKWAAGSFIFCGAATFRELGGFSQELFVAEEIDFSQRLKQWARAHRKKVVILHRHPLKTSARKMVLYSFWEHFRFLARTVFCFGGTFKDRSACTPWYDGRR